MNIYSVISGDVVDSEKLSKKVNYGQQLDETFSLFLKNYKKGVVLDVDRYSGDHFQILMHDLPGSLRGAIFIYTYLAFRDPPIPVRLSLGIGQVEVMPSKRVSEGDGDAFRISGRNESSMRKHQRIIIAGSPDVIGKNENKLLQGASALLSALLTELTRERAEAIWYTLQGFTQKEIAEIIGVKQQAISLRLRAANWDSLELFLGEVENIFDKPPPSNPL